MADKKEEIIQAVGENNGRFTINELIDHLCPTGYGKTYARRTLLVLKDKGEIQLIKRKLWLANGGEPRLNTRMLRSVRKWGSPEEIEACRRALMAMRSIQDLQAIREEVDMIIQFMIDPYQVRPLAEEAPVTEHDFSWLTHT